jgi:hypothetical protein
MEVDMEHTTEIKHRADGTMTFTHRFICDNRAPRSIYQYEDFEAMRARYEADEQPVPEVGKLYLIATKEYAGYSNTRGCDYLCWTDDDGEGLSGNSDPASKLYHGWRGTTDGWALYGHGVRQVLAVRYRGKRSKRITVVLGRDRAAENS